MEGRRGQAGGGGQCWRHHRLTRAGAAGGCGGRKTHLLPFCGGTREMISSKWKKRRVVCAIPGRGMRAARCCHGAVPRLLLPCGAGEGTRVPVQGLASEAAGDSDTYQAILCCKYPLSGYFTGAAVTMVRHPTCKERAFPNTHAMPTDRAMCAWFPFPWGLPQHQRRVPHGSPGRGSGWTGKIPTLGASLVPGKAIPPLLPSHTMGRRSLRRLVLLR